MSPAFGYKWRYRKKITSALLPNLTTAFNKIGKFVQQRDKYVHVPVFFFTKDTILGYITLARASFLDFNLILSTGTVNCKHYTKHQQRKTNYFTVSTQCQQIRDHVKILSMHIPIHGVSGGPAPKKVQNQVMAFIPNGTRWWEKLERRPEIFMHNLPEYDYQMRLIIFSPLFTAPNKWRSWRGERLPIITPFYILTHTQKRKYICTYIYYACMVLFFL